MKGNTGAVKFSPVGAVFSMVLSGKGNVVNNSPYREHYNSSEPPPNGREADIYTASNLTIDFFQHQTRQTVRGAIVSNPVIPVYPEVSQKQTRQNTEVLRRSATPIVNIPDNYGI